MLYQNKTVNGKICFMLPILEILEDDNRKFHSVCPLTISMLWMEQLMKLLISFALQYLFRLVLNYSNTSSRLHREKNAFYSYYIQH